ncbi:MAG: alpha/beta fold hydrolase [Mangrovicoccus sp.]
MIEALEIGGRKLMISRKLSGDQDPGLPTVVYLGGLLADQLTDDKESRAFSLEQEASLLGYQFVRFNFTAHGNLPETRSSGEFSDITISRMIGDAISVLKYYDLTSVAWVGSSIGAGLLPFLAAQVAQQQGVINEGFFTISGMPPRALAGFIYMQMNDEQRASVRAGQSVTIESPTLPVPVKVSPEQISDVEKYDYTSASTCLTNGPTVGIAGLQDSVSTVEQNRMLLKALSGSDQGLQVFDAPHDIPDEFMNPAFRDWLGSIKLRQ